MVSINRTLVELKLEVEERLLHFDCVYQSYLSGIKTERIRDLQRFVEAINRTLVELKHPGRPGSALRRDAINRTLVELKRVDIMILEPTGISINRTLVELKHFRP